MNSIDDIIKNKDAHALAEFIRATGLTLDESNQVIAKTNEAKEYCQKQQEYYDQRQLIQKILLNS